MAGRSMFADGVLGELQWQHEQRSLEADCARQRGDFALARSIARRPLPLVVADPTQPFGARVVPGSLSST